MKSQGKILMSMAVGACVLTSSAFALDDGEIINSSIIPQELQANVTIEYLGNSQWKVIDAPQNENKQNSEIIIEKPVLTPEQQAELDKENQLIEQINKQAEDLPVYVITLPDPINNMRVKYDNWGNPDEIYVKNSDGTYSEGDFDTVLVEKKANNVNILKMVLSNVISILSK